MAAPVGGDRSSPDERATLTTTFGRETWDVLVTASPGSKAAEQLALPAVLGQRALTPAR